MQKNEDQHKKQPGYFFLLFIFIFSVKYMWEIRILAKKIKIKIPVYFSIFFKITYFSHHITDYMTKKTKNENLSWFL